MQETGDYNAFFANTFNDFAYLTGQAIYQLGKMNVDGDFYIHVLDGNVPDDTSHAILSYWEGHGAGPSRARLHRTHPDPADYWALFESAVRQYVDFAEDQRPIMNESGRVLTSFQFQSVTDRIGIQSCYRVAVFRLG